MMRKVKLKNHVYSKILFSSLLLFFACKKGKDDPFISLQSRENRIEGLWVLESGKEDNPFISKIFSSGMAETKVYNAGVLDTTYTLPYSRKIELFKDGHYKENINDYYLYAQRFVETKTKNNWWWKKNTSKKDRIAFERDKNDYSIIRLTDKELVLESTRTDLNGDGRDTYYFKKQKE